MSCLVGRMRVGPVTLMFMLSLFPVCLLNQGLLFCILLCILFFRFVIIVFQILMHGYGRT